MGTQTKQKSSLPLIITIIVAFFILAAWLGQKDEVQQNLVLQGTTPVAVSGCLHSNEVNFSASEELRLKEIMVSVMQGNADMPTPAIYNEFWSTMFAHGTLCQEDLALTRSSLASAAECNKLFYQDALTSLRAGKTYRSSQRSSCEDKTRVAANEELMFKIATGQPVVTASGSIVFTERTVQTSLNDINTKLDGLDRLFSSTAPLVSSNRPSSVNSTLEDRSCEETHGPSTYVSNPASAGGGAWCDCKPGYESKLISTADGPSSWCYKK